MSIFSGNLNDTSRLHYIFTTDNSEFEYIGLAQFTLQSLYSYCKANHVEIEKTNINSTLKSTLVSAKDKTQDIFLKDFNSLIKDIYYYKFDLSTKKYAQETITVDRMNELITKFETLKTRENYNDRDTLKSVRDIQNSAYKYLQIELTIEENLGGLNFPVILKLFFKDNTDIFTGERVLAQKASNLVTGVPRRSTGAKYGARSTNDATGKQNNIGQYSAPSEGGDTNTANMVSGPLKMSFNKSIGAWESGTQQILAKLLTDIDKPSIKNVSISITDSADNKDFYDTDSEYYMGGFTTGLAMPLSVEDGNPHLFGPNCITCGGEQKIEKIRVVNRAPRSFKSGTIVMCSQIDGEWIIQDFGAEDMAPSATTVGDWSFIKLIANSDAYFKDDRYINGDGTVNFQYRANISPDTYAAKMRLRYYAELQAVNGGDSFNPLNYAIRSVIMDNIKTFSIDISKLAKYNSYPEVSGRELNSNPQNYSIASNSKEIFESCIVPNKNYFVSTIFDQLGSNMGGTAGETNFIQKTNVNNNTTNKLELDGSSFPFFWGPVFVDGYQSQDVARIKNYGKENVSVANGELSSSFIEYFGEFDQGELKFNPFQLGNAFLNSSTVDMFLANDSNAKELPAEVGVLSSGNPLEVMSYIIKQTDQKENLLNLMSVDSHFLVRHVHLYTTSNVDLYNMKPVSPNKIQFSPLQAEFAAHADYYSQFAIKPSNFERNFYTSSRSLLKSQYANKPNFWGKMFDRYVGVLEKIPKYPTCDVYNQSVVHSQEFYNVPYDCYIKSIPTSKPIGTPLLFSDSNSQYSGANLVGVIAAKNRFKRKGGGKLTINLEQNFGLSSYKTTAGGQVDPVSWVGVLLGGSSNALRQNSNPQWGSDNSDSYDSFGTTAMHVRVFDAWPKELTVYDARYFSVLHYNPGRIFSNAKSTNVGISNDELTKKFKDAFTKWNTPSETQYYHKADISTFNYKRDIDQLEYSVDFRVPTYADLSLAFSISNIDNSVIPVGELITKDTIIRPENEWRVNTIRRGQLLTKGGFRYFQSVIGLADGGEIIDAGLGYTNDQVVTLAKGVKLKLKVNNSDGKINGFEFYKDDDDNEYRGVGFIPSDFSKTEKIKDVDKTGYFVKLPGPKQAEIYFPKGVVYQILKKDTGPQERCPITRLSSSSNRGEGVVNTTQTTILDIEANTSGEYDAFYHFHNDVTHTLMFSYAQVPGFYQYAIMTIT